MTEKEYKKFKKFKEKHTSCFINKKQKIKVVYSNSGIGVHVKIKCCSCDIKEDITDYKSW